MKGDDTYTRADGSGPPRVRPNCWEDDAMRTYLIALKRDARGTAPADWARTVRSVPGVRLVGAETAPVLRVEATPEALEQICRQVGPFCNIEPVIRHQPS
jgi:hypothetical protein